MSEKDSDAAQPRTKIASKIDTRLDRVVTELAWNIGQFSGKDGKLFSASRNVALKAPLSASDIVFLARNYPRRSGEDKSDPEKKAWGAPGSATRIITDKIPGFKVLIDPADPAKNTITKKYLITPANTECCQKCLPADPNGEIVLVPLTIKVGGQELVFKDTVKTGIKAGVLVQEMIDLRAKEGKISKVALLKKYYPELKIIEKEAEERKAQAKAKKEAEAKEAKGEAKKTRVEAPAPKAEAKKSVPKISIGKKK